MCALRAEDWRFAAEQFVMQIPDEVIVHCCVLHLHFHI
jgi:hypothetical protein